MAKDNDFLSIVEQFMISEPNRCYRTGANTSIQLAAAIS